MLSFEASLLAFLSVRLPAATRDRLKAAAALRGESVQTLVGGLVERFLTEEGRGPPLLAGVLAALRPHAPILAGHGVTELWVFGSVARGQVGPDSDVDLLVEFGAQARPSLLGLASLRVEFSKLLGTRADLVERETLLPAVRAAAERDAVRVV